MHIPAGEDVLKLCLHMLWADLKTPEAKGHSLCFEFITTCKVVMTRSGRDPYHFTQVLNIHTI